MQEAARAMMEAESTGNFDLGIGTASLSWFVPLLRAQLLTVAERFDEALGLFSEYMASAESQGVARLLVSFHSDSAWCRFRLGQIGAALEDVHACISVAEADCDPDDLAASLARIAVILEAHGKSAEAAELRERSRKSLAEHIEAQTNLLALLFDVLPDGVWISKQ
jgi:tetratricopeptide (TPR) repeat protein